MKEYSVYLGLFFAIVIYIMLILTLQFNIYSDVEAESKTSIRKGIIPLSKIHFFERNYMTIFRISCVIFPLYYFFEIGACVGNVLYNILIQDKNENRIASWVV